VIELELPWPPTINNYFGYHGSRRFVAKRGKDFREHVGILCMGKDLQVGRLKLYIEAYVPDKRKRDLDNVLKALLDALQHGGLFKDDSQIDDLHIVRKEAVEDGLIKITLGSI